MSIFKESKERSKRLRQKKCSWKGHNLFSFATTMLWNDKQMKPVTLWTLCQELKNCKTVFILRNAQLTCFHFHLSNVTNMMKTLQMSPLNETHTDRMCWREQVANFRDFSEAWPAVFYKVTHFVPLTLTNTCSFLAENNTKPLQIVKNRKRCYCEF